MNKLLFAGSFDPPTVGHIDLVRRAAAHGAVTVGIFINEDKTYLFSAEQRAEMLRLATADIPHVSVVIGEGFTADYARAGGYTHLVRGYRDDTDLAYEEKMADYNRARGNIETLLLPADPALTAVSSTRVRDAIAARNLTVVASCLPPAVLAYLNTLGVL